MNNLFLISTDKNFLYEFDSESGILFKYYYGTVNFKVDEKSWNFAFENKLIPNKISGFILDYRNASLEFEPDEQLKISDFYKRNINIFGGYKIAVITEDATENYFPVALEKKVSGFATKPFTSLISALKWVLN